jgi:enoyl-CoA hydratase/carnithine racemase
MKTALFGSQLERLKAALENEVVNQVKCFETADCLEGIRAFLGKRSPKFEGR